VSTGRPQRTRAGAVLFALTLAVSAGPGCGRGSAPPRSSTVRMADTLAVIYSQAIVNPKDYLFLSGERAEAIQAMVRQQSGPGAFNGRSAGPDRLLAACPNGDLDGKPDPTRPLAGKVTPATRRSSTSPPGVAAPRRQETRTLATVCILPSTGRTTRARRRGPGDDRAYMIPALPGRSRLPMLSPCRMAVGECRGVPTLPDAVLARGRGALPRYWHRRRSRRQRLGLGGLDVEDFNGDGRAGCSTSWGSTIGAHLSPTAGAAIRTIPRD
jgi:hypothetical protein